MVVQDRCDLQPDRFVKVGGAWLTVYRKEAIDRTVVVAQVLQDQRLTCLDRSLEHVVIKDVPVVVDVLEAGETSCLVRRRTAHPEIKVRVGAPEVSPLDGEQPDPVVPLTTMSMCILQTCDVP